MRRLTVALPVVLIAGLVACTSTAAKPAPTRPTVARVAAGFPNPVTLARKAGCVPGPGVVHGSTGINGDFQVADCTYPSQTSITVKTFKTTDALSSELAASSAQDGQARIVGPVFVIYVDTQIDPNTNGYAPFVPSPAVIAARVGGHVQH